MKGEGAAGGSSFRAGRGERAPSAEERAWLEAFEDVSGTEEDASSRWRTVLQVARRRPPLAAVLGVALGSVVLEPLGQRSVLVHGHGSTSSARDRLLWAAAAAVGDPRGLVVGWRTAPMPMVQRARLAGILPLFLREAPTGGAVAPSLGALLGEGVLGAVDAKGRARPPWTLGIVSTGSDPLPATPPWGRSVLQVRLADDEPEDVRRAGAAAAASSGWPLVWLASSPSLEDVSVALGEASEAIEGRQPVETRGAMASAAVGFALLGRLVGDEEPVARAAELVAQAVGPTRS